MAKLFFLRAGIAVGLAVVAFVAGTFLGGRYCVPAGSGLAGPAIALGYGAGGALAGLAAGALIGLGLEPPWLHRVALATAAVAVPTLVAIGWLMALADARYYDPDEAYATLPQYDISVQQIVVTDPYLSTRTEIDTGARRWATTLPDGRVCSGNLRAAAQARVATAVRALAALPEESLQSCRRSADTAEQRITWSMPSLDRSSSGSIDVSSACLRDTPAIAKVIFAVKNVSMREPSKVKCQ